MTDREIIIEVARLGGWMCLGGCCEPEYRGWVNPEMDRTKFGGGMQPLPNYTTSRDAIIPVIEKLKNDRQRSSNPGDYPTWCFSGDLLELLDIQLYDNGSPLKAPFDVAWQIVTATPRQLCTALLKATGKWKE